MQGIVDKKFLSVARELAHDVHDVFLGALDLITSEGLLELFREAARENEWIGQDITRRIAERMSDIGVYDYFVGHLNMSVSAHVFREIILGKKFSRSTLLNILAIRIVFGSVRALGDVIIVRPDLREDAVLYPEAVINAAKNLLTTISESSFGGGASTLNRKFNDAFSSVVVSDPLFVEGLVKNHKQRGWERRWGLRDEIVLDAIKRRFKDLEREPICISKERLVRGIIDRSELYFAKHRFVKTVNYVDCHCEFGERGRQRRLKRLASIYPMLLDKNLVDCVENVMGLEAQVLYGAVCKLENRVRKWKAENNHDDY